MTVSELVSSAGYRVVSLPEPEREINGVYVGDLLSWVMGRLDADNAWVTIMSNINIVAVAALADPSCIILAEGVSPDEGVIEKAISQEVNILRSAKNTFEICADLKSVL